MIESNLFGVSVRAWLAIGTVFSGLAFLYILGLFLTDKDIRLLIINAVVGFISLALGYYMGQRQADVRRQEPPAQ